MAATLNPSVGVHFETLNGDYPGGYRGLALRENHAVELQLDPSFADQPAGTAVLRKAPRQLSPAREHLAVELVDRPRAANQRVADQRRAR